VRHKVIVTFKHSSLNVIRNIYQTTWFQNLCGEYNIVEM